MKTLVNLIVCFGLIQTVWGMPQDWGEQASAAGAVMLAEGVERFRDGVSMKEKYGRKYDVFGVPVGGEFDYKIGVGDSLNRDRRQIQSCGGKKGRPDMPPPPPEDEEVPLRERRQAGAADEPSVGEDGQTFDVEFDIPEFPNEDGGGGGHEWQPGEKKWYRKFWESCKKFAQKISKLFQSQGVTNE